MRAWILANLKNIKNAIVFLTSLISVFYFFYLNYKISNLQEINENLNSKILNLKAQISQKSDEISILNENCKEKEQLNSQINEVKNQILNSKNTAKNGVDESLKKAGEFILQRAK